MLKKIYINFMDKTSSLNIRRRIKDLVGIENEGISLEELC